MADPLPTLPATVAPGTVEALLDRSGALIYVLDAHERVVAANAAFRHRSELDASVYADLPTLLGALYPEPTVRESALLAHRKALAGGPPRPAEWSFQAALGEPRHVRWQFVLQGSSADRLLYVVGEDLTERRRLEHWVRVQNQLLELVTEAVIVVDPAGAVRHWAGAAPHLFGVDATTALDRPAHELVLGDGGAERMREWVEAALEHGSTRVEAVLRGAGGAPLDAQVTAMTLAGDRGQPEGVALRIARAAPPPAAAPATPATPPWERAVTQVGSVGVVLTRPDGGILTWSLGAERLAATSAAKAVGKRLFDEVMPVAGVSWDGVSSRVARRGRYQGRVVVERPGGGRVTADLDAAAVRGEDGALAAVLLFLVDRTDAQDLADEMLATKSAALGALMAEGARRWLLDAVAAVEPDHRVVLARVADLQHLGHRLAEGASWAELAEFARRRRLGEGQPHLDDLAGHLADGMARLRTLAAGMARFLEPEPEPPSAVRLNAEIETARALVGHALAPDVRLAVELADLPAVRASRGPLLRSLCLLLLAAAEQARGAEDATVTVEARAGAGWVYLEVRENGEGVSLEVQSRLGDLGWLAAQRGYGPLYLGLAREGLRAAGGTLEVGGAVGTGTHLRVSFPVADAAAAVQDLSAPVAAPGAHGRVLVVLDDDLLRRALVRSLAEQHQVEAHAALADALAAGGDDPYDAAVVGFVTPDRLGLQLLDRLVEGRPGLARNTVVLLPAGVRHVTRERLLDGGWVVLGAPADLATVRSIVGRLVPGDELLLDEAE